MNTEVETKVCTGHAGCWFCYTPICNDCADVPDVRMVEHRMAFVEACADCGKEPLADDMFAWMASDPESFDATRPVDLDSCVRCQGTGGVRVDHSVFAGEFVYDECPDCVGTGQRGAA